MTRLRRPVRPISMKPPSESPCRFGNKWNCTGPTLLAPHATAVMAPLGFGLESDDTVGHWRTKDGAFALRGQSTQFVTCLTRKLMTYAPARGLESSDKPAVDEIVRRAGESQYEFSALVYEIVANASRPGS